MTRRASWRSVVLAVLLVGATLAGSVGTASAASGGPYTHTYTGDGSTLLIDFGSHSGQVDVKLTSDEVPGSSNIIYAGTLSTNQMSNNKVFFINGGAYDSVTATVTGPPNRPTFFTEGDKIAREAYSLGSSGGDADMKCGALEKVRSASPSSAKVVDCTGYPGISSINTSSTDASQTKIDLYQDAANLQAGNDAFFASSQNGVPNTEARSKGIAAYVDAVNNGSGEIVARAAAIDAVEAYNAKRQQNLANRWESTLAVQYTMVSTAENETDISGSYAGNLDVPQRGNSYVIDEQSQSSVSFVDGSTRQISELNVKIYYDTGTSQGTETTGLHYHGYSNGDDYVRFENVTVDGYESGVDKQESFSPERFTDRWEAIEADNQQIEDEITTIVNNTYEPIQQGELNASELLTAGTTVQEYSPSDDGNYSTYAYRLLTSVGINRPENLENLGSMRVNVSNSGTYEGILLSRESPPSGEFEVGNSYNPAVINGSQYLVQSDNTRELTSNFTLESITTKDDENVQSVSYDKNTYKVTNVTGLRDLFNESELLRAQIEAREQAAVANSGVPSSDGGGPDNQQYLLIIAGAGVAAIVVLNVVNQR